MDELITYHANVGQILHERLQNLERLLLLGLDVWPNTGHEGLPDRGSTLHVLMLRATELLLAAAPDLTDAQHNELGLEQLVVVKQPSGIVDVRSEDDSANFHHRDVELADGLPPAPENVLVHDLDAAYSEVIPARHVPDDDAAALLLDFELLLLDEL